MIKNYYWAMAVIAAFVAGSIATGTLAFAGDDDELSSLLCPVGEAMTGILFEDDDEILDVFCGPVADATNEILGFYQKAETELGNGGTLDLQVNCDEGDSVTGGGHGAASFNSVIRISNHHTDLDGEGWRNIWQSAGDGFGHTTTVECADYAPVHVP